MTDTTITNQQELLDKIDETISEAAGPYTTTMNQASYDSFSIKDQSTVPGTNVYINDFGAYTVIVDDSLADSQVTVETGWSNISPENLGNAQVAVYNALIHAGQTVANASQMVGL